MEFFETNGVKLPIYFQKYSGSIKRDPILLIHGFTGTAHHHYSYELKNYSKVFETHIIAYDLRSHGSSVITHDVDYQERIHLDDLEQLVSHLQNKFELQQFIIFGSSFGGGLANRFTINHPDFVSSLILASTTPKYSIGVVNAFSYIKSTLELFLEHSYSKLNPEQRKFVSILQKIHDQYNPPFEKFLGFIKYIDAFSERIEDWSWLEEMKENILCPVLIIHGNKDYVSIEHAIEMDKALSNSKLVILENLGHLPHRKNPVLVQNHILNFLKED